MQQVRVKICGITSVADACAAAQAGADAIGLNFVSGPRMIDTVRGDGIVEALPVFCTAVALVDLSDAPRAETVLDFARRHRVSCLQVYGTGGSDRVARLRTEGFRVLMACPVRSDELAKTVTDLLAGTATQPDAVVVDAHHPHLGGGTGRSLDWRVVGEAIRRHRQWPPIILAGGLTADNVADAVRLARPYGVDVSSGVESAPGQKDSQQMVRFVQRAGDARG